MTSSQPSLLRSLLGLARPLALALVCALPAVACGGDDDSAAPAAGSTASTVSGEDIINIEDLLVEDTGAGATKKGDPAIWLETARQESKRANGYVRGVLGRLTEMASATAPTRQGKLPSGDPFAVWQVEKDGVTFVLVVAKTGENRVRYYYEGRQGTDRKPLMTGVFIKRAAKRGAGRLHLDLTNMNALTGAPDATGRLHLWFANAGDARARRVRYREVKPKNVGVEGAANHGLDLIHKPGKGGLIRAYSIGDLGSRIPDLADLDGVQLAAFRVRWTPEGGRAGGAIFDVTKDGLVKLGDTHECWTGGGLRAAYKSFTGKENEGDTVEKTACGGFDEEAPPATVTADGVADAEADTELAEALTISEDDAAVTLDAGQ